MKGQAAAQGEPLDELRRQAGLSRSALAERFTHLIGRPPMHSLAQWRIQVAARELRDTSGSSPRSRAATASRRSAPHPPRRFAAGMAATMNLAIAAVLVLVASATAWVLEAVLVSAVLLVVFRVCEGAAAYHLLVRAMRAAQPARPAAAPRQ